MAPPPPQPPHVKWILEDNNVNSATHNSSYLENIDMHEWMMNFDPHKLIAVDRVITTVSIEKRQAAAQDKNTFCCSGDKKKSDKKGSRRKSQP
jgi:hypothetical protein